MLKDFVEELTWRGMIHDIMPETENHLNKAMRAAYIGFDPTADSLHIGNLVPIMLLAHFQRCGHKPVALVGGATGMIGDPSGKSTERNLLDEKTLRHNQECVKNQLAQFLDFTSGEANQALMVNNYDWMKEFTFLNFIRDVGKHITINYMMAKDSVKNRVRGEETEGMSFTEFTYQLVQGYDFLHLFKSEKCTLQMGGSDQWGNITTGTEMIRRIGNGKGYALTCPLITKSDGSKFGKSEGGNIWLDSKRTSPYKFYQYWLNTSNEDAEKYIKIFTFLDKEAIVGLISECKESHDPRFLQKKLAKEVTLTVHGEEALNKAIEASSILFSKTAADDIKNIDLETLLDVFEGVPLMEISKNEINNGLDIIGALAEKTKFLKSNGEARRALKENSVSVNFKKVSEGYTITEKDVLKNQLIVLQRGKKKKFLIKLV